MCGLIAHYNDGALQEATIDRLPATMHDILAKSLTVRGFIQTEFVDQQQDTFLKEAAQWIAEGKLKWREDVVDGLDQAPEAFIGLLEGRNFGKLIVRLNPQ